MHPHAVSLCANTTTDSGVLDLPDVCCVSVCRHDYTDSGALHLPDVSCVSVCRHDYTDSGVLHLSDVCCVPGHNPRSVRTEPDALPHHRTHVVSVTSARYHYTREDCHRSDDNDDDDDDGRLLL